MAGSEGSNTPTHSPDSLGLRAPVHKDDAIWRLEVMSRRGRLPGFQRMVGGFSVAAHGTPFDKTLVMKASDVDGSEGVLFRPEMRLDRRMPAITLVIFVLTVWPGVLLTDSFLRMHFGFYEKWTADGLVTWWWYIPLTVLSLVWAWFSAIKKSEASANSAARETLEKMASELGGELVPLESASRGAAAASAG
jgi:hypothetical protein